jgi:hypothetical protein
VTGSADSALTAVPTATAPKLVFLFMIVTSSRSAPGNRASREDDRAY